MESSFLLLSTFIALLFKEEDWKVFLCTTCVCFILGLSLKFKGQKNKNVRMSRADSFFIVSLSWIIFSVIGCIPFIHLLHLDVASAFFETMSGFTTTGATVLSDIDSISHTLKFWRSVSQWMGGLGIVVFSLALIPVYEIKNSNIYSAEVTGIGLDKLRPKIASTARTMFAIYLLLTIVCAILYYLGPMNLFDAICHSMTTVATGGFSTHSASIGYFNSTYIEYICILFMLLSSINFSLYYYVSIKRANMLFKNEEARWFIYIVGFFLLLFFCLFQFSIRNLDYLKSFPSGIEETFRTSLFHVVTIITSSGFAAQKFDYVLWGAPYWMPTILLMVLGGCAGSTAGGVKIVRFLICIKSVLNEFKLQIHPRAVLGVKINGHIIPNERVRKTLGFIFLYILLVAIGMTILNFIGCDTDTAFGGCISMLSNIGPSTGMTGPADNYSIIPSAGKWLMSSYMLIGRLEIYTVLFLLLPSYWKEKN